MTVDEVNAENIFSVVADEQGCKILDVLIRKIRLAIAILEAVVPGWKDCLSHTVNFVLYALRGAQTEQSPDKDRAYRAGTISRRRVGSKGTKQQDKKEEKGLYNADRAQRRGDTPQRGVSWDDTGQRDKKKESESYKADQAT